LQEQASLRRYTAAAYYASGMAAVAVVRHNGITVTPCIADIGTCIQ